MKRREFITALGGAAVWPLSARAQQAERSRRIGVMMGLAENDPEAQTRVAAFVHGLSELGWEIGRNIQIDYRWTGGNPSKMQAMAKEMVALRPEVILANTTPVTDALAKETKTIPIVFTVVSDPVGSGLVASLAEPGGNITGFINLENSIGGKWVELLKEISPNVTRALILYNPDTAAGRGQYFLPSFELASSLLKIKPIAAEVHSPADIETTIADFASEPNGGLVAMSDTFITVHRRLISAQAELLKLPVVFPNPTFAKEGGLLGYGPDSVDLFRRPASYIDRILKGENPATLPVQVPTKFSLTINMKVAKAIGIIVPSSLLARADEVIE